MITRAQCGIVRAGGICREVHSDDMAPNPVTVTGRFDVTVRPDGTTFVRGLDEATCGIHMLFPPAEKSVESATPTEDTPTSPGATEVMYAAALLLALARLHRINGTTPLASLNPAIAARSVVRRAGVDPGDKAALERLSLAPWTEKSSESAAPTRHLDPEVLRVLWDTKPGDAPRVINGGIMPIPGEDYSETVARHYGVPVATPDPGECGR